MLEGRTNGRYARECAIAGLPGRSCDCDNVEDSNRSRAHRPIGFYKVTRPPVPAVPPPSKRSRRRLVRTTHDDRHTRGVHGGRRNPVRLDRARRTHARPRRVPVHQFAYAVPGALRVNRITAPLIGFRARTRSRSGLDRVV